MRRGSEQRTSELSLEAKQRAAHIGVLKNGTDSERISVVSVPKEAEKAEEAPVTTEKEPARPKETSITDILRKMELVYTGPKQSELKKKQNSTIGHIPAIAEMIQQMRQKKTRSEQVKVPASPLERVEQQWKQAEKVAQEEEKKARRKLFESAEQAQTYSDVDFYVQGLQKVKITGKRQGEHKRIVTFLYPQKQQHGRDKKKSNKDVYRLQLSLTYSPQSDSIEAVPDATGKFSQHLDVVEIKSHNDLIDIVDNWVEKVALDHGEGPDTEQGQEIRKKDVEKIKQLFETAKRRPFELKYNDIRIPLKDGGWFTQTNVRVRQRQVIQVTIGLSEQMDAPTTHELDLTLTPKGNEKYDVSIRVKGTQPFSKNPITITDETLDNLFRNIYYWRSEIPTKGIQAIEHKKKKISSPEVKKNSKFEFNEAKQKVTIGVVTVDISVPGITFQEGRKEKSTLISLICSPSENSYTDGFSLDLQGDTLIIKTIDLDKSFDPEIKEIPNTFADIVQEVKQWQRHLVQKHSNRQANLKRQETKADQSIIVIDKNSGFTLERNSFYVFTPDPNNPNGPEYFVEVLDFTDEGVLVQIEEDDGKGNTTKVEDVIPMKESILPIINGSEPWTKFFNKLA